MFLFLINNILKSTLCIFFGILFNNHRQSHNNNNKNLNRLTYYDAFNYMLLGKNNIIISSDIFDVEVKMVINDK